MSLQNASIAADATVTVTGGTAFTFSWDGQQTGNGLQLINANNTDFKTRETLLAKYRRPSVDSLGVYGKAKKTLSFVDPLVTTDGSTKFPLIRIELEDMPSEMTVAQNLEMRKKAAQMLIDSDFENFWQYGSMA